MKFLITNQKDNEAFNNPPDGYVFQELGPLCLLLEEGEQVRQIEDKYLFLNGYIKDHGKEVKDREGQEKSVIDAISSCWPLPLNISGSFSAVLVEKNNEKISLCTDHIGLYPLYHLKKEDKFYFSNSIILTGIVSGAELDPAGVAQRCLGPDFFNLGSRTILKDCKRLLPGECRKYLINGEYISADFDNSLYQDISDPSQEHTLAKPYWNAYQQEVAYCLNESNSANIALSGGIDSRLALGAIPEGKNIFSYTFGNRKNYESRIAARLSKIKGAEFIACDQPDLYFPSPELLRYYTLKTEGIELCSWLEIVEAKKTKEKEPLLLGELCEALPGRKISRFNTRKFRKDNFVKFYIRNRNYKFEDTSLDKFQEWKGKILKNYTIYYSKKNLKKLGYAEERDFLMDALESDLNEIFDRIAAHGLPYTELYDELFSWYTYARMRLSKQLLTANCRFNAYSPAMSLRMLRLTSSLHPNLRLNYRFIKKLFKENEELKVFKKVPTSQAPFVPQNAPDIIKFTVWGIRSGIDQFLIKRLMKKQDPDLRYRLLPSINWVKIYQNQNLKKNLNGYFHSQHLSSDYIEGVKNQALGRRDLENWPFANMNIINAAVLNIELDLIYCYRKQYEN